MGPIRGRSSAKSGEVSGHLQAPESVCEYTEVLMATASALERAGTEGQLTCGVLRNVTMHLASLPF